MIEPTDEMRVAFNEAPNATPGCRCAICLNHRLAAVLAIVDRDRAVVRPADLRTVLSQRQMHCHRAPGRWDDSGLLCRECAARDRLWAALGGAP